MRIGTVGLGRGGANIGRGLATGSSRGVRREAGPAGGGSARDGG